MLPLVSCQFTACYLTRATPDGHSSRPPPLKVLEFGGSKGNPTLHSCIASAARPLGTCAPKLDFVNPKEIIFPFVKKLSYVFQGIEYFIEPVIDICSIFAIRFS